MNTTRVIKENLKAVVDSGYAMWFDENDDNSHDLGVGIFRCDKFSNVTLCLYSQGLFYETLNGGHKIKLNIKYTDIKAVNSTLTVQHYSEASKAGDYFCLTPMKLACFSGDYELMIPLIIYSGVLISLCECIN